MARRRRLHSPSAAVAYALTLLGPTRVSVLSALYALHARIHGRPCRLKGERGRPICDEVVLALRYLRERGLADYDIEEDRAEPLSDGQPLPLSRDDRLILRVLAEQARRLGDLFPGAAFAAQTESSGYWEAVEKALAHAVRLSRREFEEGEKLRRLVERLRRLVARGQHVDYDGHD